MTLDSTTDDKPEWIGSDLWDDRTTRDGYQLAKRARQASTDAERDRVREAVAKSAAVTRTRRQEIPDASPTPGLPISAHADAIVDALSRHQVAVVCGETGSGKTTQLPKILMQAGWGARGQIGHTQPRRLAARSVSERIADELGTELGGLAGFVTRFDKEVSKDTRIKLMTDGVLLAESARDRFLNRYEVLVVDEAHERTLNVDFLLGYLKRLLPHRPDLKVVVTSATIDPDQFSRFFDDAPVINVKGRGYPVDLAYRPPAEQTSLPEAIESAIDEVWTQSSGDVLVFLPGERDIRDAEHYLARSKLLSRHSGLEVVPLYARLTRSAQNRIFAPSAGRRIVLATNVAETSLTVPGIRYVVDSGLARMSRYSPTARVQQLPIEPVSKASAKQRAGRCGRVAPGICVRLYSEDDFEVRPAFTDPEVQRTNLASVLLTMADLKLGSIESFEFIDPPATRHVRDGRNLLSQLGALQGKQVTDIGHQLARLPLDPRLGRMLLAGGDNETAVALRVLVAGLTIADPRERPQNAREAADEAQAELVDGRSDFMGLLRLWDAFTAARRAYGGNQLRQWCRQRYLNFMRLREWEDLVRQLRRIGSELGLATPPNTTELAAVDYQALHEAILTGLIDHIGQLAEKPDYRGIRNRHFRIFPGSNVANRTPKWIMAAELIETRRLYAHRVAAIEPHWIERAAPHLVVTEHYNPRWSKRRGQVIASERVRLFGLTLADGRRRDFGPLDPEAARHVFIFDGLVAQCVIDKRGRLPAFLEHNRRQIETVKAEEARLRRQDLLVDETAQAELYDQRLPAEVCDRKTLFKWLSDNDDADLRLRFDELKRDEAPRADVSDYPNNLDLGGVDAPINYRFEPGAEDDGMTIRVPLATLNDVSLAAAVWNVPGFLTDLFTEYLRALPKRIRRDLVPIPDTARAAAERARFGIEQPASALRDAVQLVTGIEIPTDAWAGFEPSPHLKPRFEIVDDAGEPLETGRDLGVLRESLGDQAATALADEADDSLRQTGLSDWPDADLSADVDVAPGGVAMRATPTLVDRGDSVDLTLAPPGDPARSDHLQGVVRLVRLALNRTVRRIKREHIGVKTLRDAPLPHPLTIARVTDERWRALTVDPEPIVFADLLGGAIRAQMDEAPLYTHAAFEPLVKRCRSQLDIDAVAIWQHLSGLIEQRNRLVDRLDKQWPAAAQPAITESREQLDHLVYVGMVSQSSQPIAHLRRVARYLRGIDIRLDKLARDGADADQALQRQIRPYWDQYKKLALSEKEPHVDRDALAWLIEEFRIQIFAQALGTEAKVSAKRLDRFLNDR